MVCTEPLLDLSIVVNKMQEHYTVLNRRVDRLEVSIHATNDSLRIMDEKLNSLIYWSTNWSTHVDQRFEGIDERLAEHDRRFDAIDKRLAEHDRRFDALDQKIDLRFGELKELVVDALKRRN